MGPVGTASQVNISWGSASSAVEPLDSWQIQETPRATEGFSTVQSGTSIKGVPWKLRIDLVAAIRVEGSQFIAIHHAVNEYGIGPTVEAAVEDLLSSLADYRASLEQRESRLSDQAMQDLQLLRKLLE